MLQLDPSLSRWGISTFDVQAQNNLHCDIPPSILITIQNARHDIQAINGGRRGNLQPSAMAKMGAAVGCQDILDHLGHAAELGLIAETIRGWA